MTRPHTRVSSSACKRVELEQRGTTSKEGDAPLHRHKRHLELNDVTGIAGSLESGLGMTCYRCTRDAARRLPVLLRAWLRRFSLG
jgi:hypothetical protein